MKTNKLLFAAVLCVMTLNVNTAFSQTADEIMKRVDEAVVPKNMKSAMKMNLIDSKNQVRQRDLKVFRLTDEKMMMWFLNPADVKGTSFLKITNIDRDDDMWIYLPALGKVRRIASSAKNGSFMGSDFTFEDMGDRKLKDYTYKLLKNEVLEGKQCWVVESTPNAGISTDYSKIVSWIWQDADISVKEEFYNKKGTLKKIKTTELIKVKTYWVPKKNVMQDLSVKHNTEIIFDRIEVDTNVDPSMFDQTNMTKTY